MSENLMDIVQVAEYLQMNKMTVYKLAREGRIPAFKVASEWRFRKDLIDTWLMRQLKGKPGFEELKAEVLSKEDKTVLVGDDEEAIRDYFERALKDYSVIKASSGQEALDILKKERPNLVLLDIRMPGLDGIETLKRIKEIDKNIPVIMLSAYATFESNMEAARLGAVTSIAKPVDLKDMKSVIKNALLTEKFDLEPKVSSLSKKKT